MHHNGSSYLRFAAKRIDGRVATGSAFPLFAWVRSIGAARLGREIRMN